MFFIAPLEGAFLIWPAKNKYLGGQEGQDAIR